MRLRAKPTGELFEAVGAAGHQHDLIATPGKYPGEFLSDARRGAGDDGSAVVSRWWESHMATVPALSGCVSPRYPPVLWASVARRSIDSRSMSGVVERAFSSRVLSVSAVQS